MYPGSGGTSAPGIIRRPLRGTRLELSPSSVLAMWASGLAAGASIVVRWRVVGPGFVWLSGSVVLLLGIPAALAGAGAWAIAGGAVAFAGTVAGRHARIASILLAAGAAGYLVAAALEGGWLPSLSGALLLGGITAEMMLGHWFLVDPRLPRWALRRLDAAAAVGAVADLAVLAALGALPWVGGDLAVGLGFLLLSVTTMVLIAAVWFSLGEPGYPAVMAATGLSYLAVLTAVGTTVLGRLLLDPPVLG